MQTDEIPVLFAIDNGIAHITINRAERRNALSNPTIAGLHDAFSQASADSAVRAIVLTGAGDKAFCAGGDLSSGTGIFSEGGAQTTLPLANLLRLVRRVEQPVVARINGACMAGGMALAAMCDLAIAVDTAKFGLPEARIGMFPMQVLAVLQPLLRPRDLYELTLCADPITAQRALEIGLVNSVVPRAELDAAIDALLARLMAGAPTAIRRGKYALATMASLPFEQALSFAEGQVGLLAATDDAKEGLASFVEKRTPKWTGR